MVRPNRQLFLPRWLKNIVVLLALIAPSAAAYAQIGSERYASMVVDAQSGQVISAANPDDFRFPASLTKLMTIYIAFESIRDGRLQFTDLVPMSSWAASMPPTKLGLPAGQSLTVEQAILALVTKSANDVAAAMGELLGGSEDRFAELMTVRARALGMTRTTFRNASGLPDWGQVTTARDMVTLARHLIQDFPGWYHYFGTPAFQFHGRMVLNHQTLLRTYAGADGLKTGYTEASGYNVVTSAVRGNMRLIGVVLGGSSGWERDQHMTALLDQGFQRLGVAPVEIARHEPYRGSLLIGSARAAPMPEVAAWATRGVRTPPAQRRAARAAVSAPRETASALRLRGLPPRAHVGGQRRTNAGRSAASVHAGIRGDGPAALRPARGARVASHRRAAATVASRVRVRGETRVVTTQQRRAGEGVRSAEAVGGDPRS